MEQPYSETAFLAALGVSMPAAGYLRWASPVWMDVADRGAPHMPWTYVRRVAVTVDHNPWGPRAHWRVSRGPSKRSIPASISSTSVLSPW